MIPMCIWAWCVGGSNVWSVDRPRDRDPSEYILAEEFDKLLVAALSYTKNQDKESWELIHTYAQDHIP